MCFVIFPVYRLDSQTFTSTPGLSRRALRQFRDSLRDCLLLCFIFCCVPPEFTNIHKHPNSSAQAGNIIIMGIYNNNNNNINNNINNNNNVMQNNNQPLLPTSAAERPHYYDHVHGDRALSSAASAGMRRCYQEGVLCDVALRVGSLVVHCHRLVLAGSSDFFRCLFTSEFKEKDQPEIDLSASFKNFSALNHW